MAAYIDIQWEMIGQMAVIINTSASNNIITVLSSETVIQPGCTSPGFTDICEGVIR